MARVGLLEDNARISKLCATMLNYAGHEVTIYTDATTCLNALFRVETPRDGLSSLQKCLPIDVLILDLHLPDIHGLDVLSHLRSHPMTRSLPLVFCTAATSAEVLSARSIAPQAALVEKPFRLQTLVSAISTALEESVQS